MTDGTVYLPVGQEPIEDNVKSYTGGVSASSVKIDLTNFALWIELEPTATIAGILDLIGNDFYRRNMFTYGHDLKQIVSELRRT